MAMEEENKTTATEGENPEKKTMATEEEKTENVTKHKEPSSSSSSEDSDSGDDIVLEKPLKEKGPTSPTKEHQSFSFISSTGDQSPLAPGYDPNRIPSSVFANKSANGAEWSVASNESLFSIQMGNNSFTRDHAFMLYKSGELAKAEELYGSVNGSNNNNQLSSVQEAENVVPAASSDVQEENEGKNKNETPWEIESPPVVSVEAKEDVPREEKKAAPPSVQPSNSSTSICASPHSDGSNHSTRSFAFPVLAPNASAKEEGKKHETTPKQSPEHNPPKESPAPKEDEEQPAQQKLQPKGSSRRWFNCFYCCPSRFS